MGTLLQLNTSLFSGEGQSTRLADSFVAGRKTMQPGLRVILRDLGRDPVPHLTADGFRAFGTPAQARSLDQARTVAYSDTLIQEIQQADTIVIGLPMYNFGIPSALKAYFDHIARPGMTFRYTENGPAGLLTGKSAYVFAARGGFYAGTPADTQTSYIRNFLAFLGITDITFVYAEGLAIDDNSSAAALEKAGAEIAGLNHQRAA